MTQRPATDVGLANRFHRDGGLDPGIDADLFQGRLHGQRVHDGGQHPHVVGARALHARLRQGGAAEDIAAADHDADLDTGPGDFGDLLGHRLQSLGIDAEAVAADARLARELQQDAFVARCGVRHLGSVFRLERNIHAGPIDWGRGTSNAPRPRTGVD